MKSNDHSRVYISIVGNIPLCHILDQSDPECVWTSGDGGEEA